MPARAFRITFASDAEFDLYEIQEYWSSRGERGRGQKYFRDLVLVAKRQLGNPVIARTGRIARDCDREGVFELIVFRRSYRILYEIDEATGSVLVLRFWHSHRDRPSLE